LGHRSHFPCHRFFIAIEFRFHYRPRVPVPLPSEFLTCPAQTLCRTSWGWPKDLQTGCLSGSVTESGWKWRIHSAESVWLWLNVEGEGLIWGRNERFFLKPRMFAMIGGGPEGLWNCIRHPGEHRLNWVKIPSEWLRQRVGEQTAGLRGELAEWLRTGAPVAFCGLMGVWERELCEALAKTAERPGPLRFLAEARVLEWAAARCFERPTLPKASAPTPPTDPVKRAVLLIREHLDQPLDLGAIAKMVGVSRHHLSRRVRGETGLTLQQHLRRLRIDHACDALASGRMNVTEAALEVGYQSLSHFAKAFREETGLTPRAWLAARKKD
jgi:AraC-like DNA-binding protein